MKRWLPLSFLTALVLLGASEGVVRLFFARNMSGRFEYGYNPTAGFVEHRDGSVELVRAGGRRFWPQRFSRKRPPGTFRVMVIGDSVPRASSLRISYANQIGERLRRLGIAAESFNLGVAGNGALRSQIILRQALNYEPSLIILHVNNSNQFEDERDGKRADAFRSWHPRNWLMKSLVIRRLYEAKTEQVMWTWLPEEIRRTQYVNDVDAQVAASMNSQKLREWDEQVLRYTTESVALARAKGVPILLLSQARLERDPQGRPFLDDCHLDGLTQSLTNHGVYQLSMKEILATTNFESLYADEAHVFAPGHELIADAVIAKLRQEGLVSALDGGNRPSARAISRPAGKR